MPLPTVNINSILTENLTLWPEIFTIMKDILKYDPVSRKTVEDIVKPLRTYFAPQIFGWGNVDKDKPALYVTNHTIYGACDGTLISGEMFLQKDILMRALVDDFHYKIPYWSDFLEKFGAVQGSRENCHTLMEGGEHIIVYPGGGREVARKKGEAHKLTWKTRTGFARMAMAHGYPIVPLAQVGGDDAYTIIADSNDLAESAIGKFLFRNSKVLNYMFKDKDHVWPLAKGLGITGLPKPVKLYFSFGAAIDTTPWKGKEDNDEAAWELREAVESCLNEQIDDLVEFKEKDPDKGLLRKWLTE